MEGSIVRTLLLASVVAFALAITGAALLPESARVVVSTLGIGSVALLVAAIILFVAVRWSGTNPTR